MKKIKLHIIFLPKQAWFFDVIDIFIIINGSKYWLKSQPAASYTKSSQFSRWESKIFHPSNYLKLNIPKIMEQ